MKYLVVSFLNEQGSMYVIPDNWLVDDCSCYWPQYVSDARIKKSSKAGEIPDDTWSKHTISIMYRTETYEKACKKLVVAQDTSDLQTEDEEHKTQSRQKRKNDYWYYEDESDNDTNKFNNSYKQSKAKMTKLLKRHILPEAPKISLAIPNQLVRNDILTNRVTSPGLLTSSPNNNTDQLSSVTNGQFNFEKATQPIFKKNTFNDPVVPSTSLNILPTDITSLVNVVMEIKVCLKDLQRQTEINTKLLQSLTAGENDKGIFDKLHLPLNDLKELNTLEELIQNDKTVFSNLVIAVASKGGYNLKDAVRRMSASLFTNQLCCQLNWTGGQRKGSEADLKLDIKNKFGLKESQCRRVLERAVLRNPPTSTVSECDFQKEIVRFLRGAPDRNGGRQARAIVSVKRRTFIEKRIADIDNDDEPQE
ncbi:uncharacterized protein LOC136084018 isoform X2 [Hydra vulgaris]|uniref:Uncharacterized protein LOC136084018 isoform X2 n=1 Tax=Hydra vulgaris TaxID=6087 RepID=A0ABM4CEJ2_HYDVU